MNIKWRLNNLLVSALLLVIAINSRADQKGYSLKEETSFQQVSSSSVVTGYSPLNYAKYDIHTNVDTGGASLSAAPILGLPGATSTYPGGSVTFPTGTNFSPTLPTGSGYNKYSVDVAGGNNLASVSAASGSGTFSLTLGNATAQPTLSLNTASPAFPSTPMLTSGGTWSGSTLLLDPTATNVLTFNTGSFTTYTTGLGGAVSYNLLNPAGTAIIPKAQSAYVPSVGLPQPVLTSFTIAPGTLVNGSNYIVKADYSQIENLNTTTFTGTGIPANPIGESHYSADTYITVLAPTPTLTSTLAGNQVIISWPPTFTGWTLQTNNNLATGTWGNYLGPVGNNSITNSPATGNLFFRLLIGIGTTGLLDGAQFFNGTVPAIGLVEYMNGTKLVAVSAYSGQVLVFFHTPVIDKTATDLIVAKGGTVLGKVPNAGFYFVGVPSGGEGTFISSMKLNQAIHDALPHVVARYMSTGVSYIDGCKLSHGNQVNCVIQGALHEYASPNCRDDDDGDGKPMVKKTIENIYKTVSEANGGNAVINISSFGGFSNGTDYNQVDSTRKAEIISRARSYLYAILTPIAELPEYYRENLVITLCAGNDNTPLTEILDQIRTDVTLANVLKNNVLIVGANEAVFHGSNDAPNDPDFANMKSVYSCDMSIGTSFAAPLAAAYIINLINDLGITAKQALNAVKIAVLTNPNNEFIEEEAHMIANMIKSGNKEVGFYSGGSNLIMRSEAMQTCTQNFYLQTTLSVAWDGSIGFMIVPAHYWRDIIGQCVLVGVIQDYKVIKEPITLINNVITGSANAMFLSGPGGSFPVTMKLTGTLNSNGAIVGTLAITSEILSQDFQVTLQKQ